MKPLKLLFLVGAVTLNVQADPNERKAILQTAREKAEVIVSDAILKLSNFENQDEFRYHQFDKILDVAQKVIVILRDPNLVFNFPPTKNSPELEGCKVEQKKLEQSKESLGSHSDPSNDEANPKSLATLAFVDETSDWRMNICHAYFKFPQLMKPNFATELQKVEARAQVLIHEAVHLALEHTRDQRGFAEIETEASWYTYEQMIFGNTQQVDVEQGRFYEDAYYLMFGFNNPFFKYNKVIYGIRYRDSVVR